MKVKVRDVVQEMDVPGPDLTVYLHRSTGEFVGVSEDEVFALRGDGAQDAPEWMRDQLPDVEDILESEDYLALPDSSDIHEWQIMRDFAGSLATSDSRASEALIDALHGSGAFRLFRAQLSRLHLDERWYRFRDQAFEQIAIDWLEAREIPYTMDSGDTRATDHS